MSGYVFVVVVCSGKGYITSRLSYINIEVLKTRLAIDNGGGVTVLLLIGEGDQDQERDVILRVEVFWASKHLFLFFIPRCDLVERNCTFFPAPPSKIQTTLYKCT